MFAKIVKHPPLLLTCLVQIYFQEKDLFKLLVHTRIVLMFPFQIFKHFKALLNEAIFSYNLQSNGVSSCKLQEKSPSVAFCNTPSLQNNYISGQITICIYLKSYRNMQDIFHPNLRCKLQETIASCNSVFTRSCLHKHRQTCLYISSYNLYLSYGSQHQAFYLYMLYLYALYRRVVLKNKSHSVPVKY